MKRGKKRLLIVLAVFLVLAAGLFFFVTDGLSQMLALTVNPVDLTDVEDGKYTGEYRFKRWSNKVEVQVSDHRIQGITILENVRAAEITDCADEVLQRVLDAQNTQVDAVSGATATSKAYLKSIENALS